MCEGCMFYPFTPSLVPWLQSNESLFIGPDVKNIRILYILYKITVPSVILKVGNDVIHSVTGRVKTVGSFMT